MTGGDTAPPGNLGSEMAPATVSNRETIHLHNYACYSKVNLGVYTLMNASYRS